MPKSRYTPFIVLGLGALWINHAYNNPQQAGRETREAIGGAFRGGSEGLNRFATFTGELAGGGAGIEPVLQPKTTAGSASGATPEATIPPLVSVEATEALGTVALNLNGLFAECQPYTGRLNRGVWGVLQAAGLDAQQIQTVLHEGRADLHNIGHRFQEMQVNC